MDPETERMLREYVLEQRRKNGSEHREILARLDRIDAQATAQAERMATHETQDEVRHVETMAELRRVETTMEHHSRKIQQLRDHDEITGQHDVAELKAEIKKRDDTADEWRKTAAKWVAGLIAGGLASWVSWTLAQMHRP